MAWYLKQVAPVIFWQRYVRPPGLHNSYCPTTNGARVFESKEHAEQNACGNEIAVEK